MTRILKHMKRVVASVAFVTAFALGAAPAMAADPLVDVAWVKANIGNAGVVFIDARPSSAYLRGHIPGAVNTNYGKDGWRVKVNGVPGLFPSDTTKLGTLIGSLGIDNSTHVVLVAPGSSSSDMGTATRLYWTFNVLGHDNVSVLNGGMTAYLKEVDAEKNPVNPLEKGAPTIAAKTFTIDLQEDMLIGEAEVQAAIDAGAIAVDNRTADQYLGVNRHGASKASGTIAGAINLPQSWMTENGRGMFRDASTLTQLYAAAGVPTDGPQVSFCNTGHWASIGWFVSSEILGNEEAMMYDASMTGWTAAGMPVEQKITTN